MRQRSGWAAAGAGAFLIVLVVALVGASGGGASPSKASADPSTKCKLTGKRYVGTTSQKKRLCFTLTADGKRIREYAFDYHNTCGGGSLRTTIRGGLSLSANGSLSTTGQGFFKDTMRGSTANGTARCSRANPGPIRDVRHQPRPLERPQGFRLTPLPVRDRGARASSGRGAISAAP